MNKNTLKMDIEVNTRFDNIFDAEQASKIPLVVNETFRGVDIIISPTNSYIKIPGYVNDLYPIILTETVGNIV